MHFSITCPKCAALFQFEAAQIEGLQRHIDREVRDEVDTLRIDADDKYDEGFRDGEESARPVEPNIVHSAERPFRELSIAIRRGDRSNAERLLDLIAADFGDRATEDVEQGRFSPEARADA